MRNYQLRKTNNETYSEEKVLIWQIISGRGGGWDFIYM